MEVGADVAGVLVGGGSGRAEVESVRWEAVVVMGRCGLVANKGCSCLVAVLSKTARAPNGFGREPYACADAVSTVSSLRRFLWYDLVCSKCSSNASALLAVVGVVCGGSTVLEEVEEDDEESAEAKDEALASSSDASTNPNKRSTSALSCTPAALLVAVDMVCVDVTCYTKACPKNDASAVRFGMGCKLQGRGQRKSSGLND